MSTSPLGAYFHPGRSPQRERSEVHKTGRVYVADPPPFGVGSKRFSKADLAIPGQDAPEYHVAYRETTQPSRWNTKGWSGIDDSVKPGRGTSTGKQYSSMAPPSGPPAYGSSLQPMYATYPNETRLQELLDLQKRRLQTGPAPGAYDVTGWQPRRTTFRRPALPELDGPFPLDDGEGGGNGGGYKESTRVREIANNFKLAGSDLGPGDYEGLLLKDVSSTLRRPPAMRIGTGAREGRTAHAKSLSVSRSIQHGIDWHVPVIIQTRPPGEAAEGGGGPQQQPQQQFDQSDPSYAHLREEEGVSPRFMQASPPRQATAGRPPMPPAPVARSVRRPVAQSPGDWDWAKLGTNYRSGFTTMHGGAYLQGDRKHMRRSGSAPVGGPAHSNSLAGFGPDSSIDIHALPATSNSIFPIPEESSTGLLRELDSAQQQQHWQQHGGRSPDTGLAWPGLPLPGSSTSTSPPRSMPASPNFPPSQGSPMRLRPLQQGAAAYGQHNPGNNQQQQQHLTDPSGPYLGGGGAADVSGGGAPGSAGGAMSRGRSASMSPNPALLTPKDLQRHNLAQQAAALAQQTNARRTEWLAKSSSDPAPGE